MDLSYRAREILSAYRYHAPDAVLAFWGILVDEQGCLWSSDEDLDVEQLVENTFLRPVSPQSPSAFLRSIAREENLRLNPRRVWQVTEAFKKAAA